MSQIVPSAVSMSQRIAAILAITSAINTRDEHRGAKAREDCELYQAFDSVFPGVNPADSLGQALTMSLITTVDEAGEPSSSGDCLALTPKGQEVLNEWNAMDLEARVKKHRAMIGKKESDPKSVDAEGRPTGQPYDNDADEHLTQVLQAIADAPPQGRRFRNSQAPRQPLGGLDSVNRPQTPRAGSTPPKGTATPPPFRGESGRAPAPAARKSPRGASPKAS